MKIKTDGAEYLCTGYYPSALSVTFTVPDGSPDTLGDHIDLITNNGVLLNTVTVSNYARRVDGGGTLTLTNAPEPVDDIESTRAAKLSELSTASQAAIVSGCDVTLSDGTTGHISLTDHDQINLSTAQAAIVAGATDYPYHLDGQLCAVYSAADILAMSTAAVGYILYHATYCNHLLTWARRAATADELSGITYGAALPDDLKNNMDTVLAAAGGTANG